MSQPDVLSDADRKQQKALEKSVLKLDRAIGEAPLRESSIVELCRFILAQRLRIIKVQEVHATSVRSLLLEPAYKWQSGSSEVVRFEHWLVTQLSKCRAGS